MADQPTFKLVIIDDEGKSTVVPLTRNDYSVGRQEGNVIRLTERNVSRKHARLEKSNGKFIIDDLESYNGVLVNNDRVKGKKTLNSGDSIQIGDYRLVFREITGADTEESVIVKESMVRPPAPRVATALPGEKPKLIIINGPRPGQIINLEDGETIVGRSENAEIEVDEASVSREHAKFILKETYCQILDMGSSNGIKINGIQTKEHFLSHGDTIEMGNILIRFIAAGAWDLLLEQLQQQEAMAAAPAWKKPAYIAIPFIFIGLAVIAGVVYLLSIGAHRPPSNKLPGELKGSAQNGMDVTNVDMLIREAQKHYDEFNWKDAIRYSADALQFEPSNEKALKIKERATRELENQPVFERALENLSEQQWETAYRTFAQLSLDSAYRTKPEFQLAITKFLEKIYAEMNESQKNQQWEVVEEKALIIHSIPEASKWYQKEADKFLKLVRKELKKDVMVSHVSKPPKGSKKDKGTSIEETKEKIAPEPIPAGSVDPIAEARKAILAGDQLKCIKILEKAKTTQMTLKMLATCYKAAGNRDRYYHILERYISKYPSAPDAEKFRSILKSAGKL
ncbi:MAG: FHA domain-containing protein [Pseudomonadota bacterium]